MSSSQPNRGPNSDNLFQDPRCTTERSRRRNPNDNEIFDEYTDSLTIRGAQSFNDDDLDAIRPLASLSSSRGGRQRKSVLFDAETLLADESQRACLLASDNCTERRNSNTNPFADQPSSSRQESVIGSFDGHSRKPSDLAPKDRAPDFHYPSRHRPSTSVSTNRSQPSTRALDALNRKEDSVPKRFSWFNPFNRNLNKTHQVSKVNSNNNTCASAQCFVSQRTSTSDLSAGPGSAVPGITKLPRALLRNKSNSAATSSQKFLPGEEKQNMNSNHRRSSSLGNHSSSLRRATSWVSKPNPIPRRYRSKSVSSLSYFFTPLEKSNTTLPIFEDDIESEKQNIQEYLAGVERLEASMKRKPWQSTSFRGIYFFIVLAFVYLVFIGQPIWQGVALTYYRWLRTPRLANLGFLIFFGWGMLQSFLPLCFCQFEKEVDDVESRDASETALIIPAYKAAAVLPQTIEAALKIFKASQIFIINNGNTPEPQDNTAEVCAKYGVNHAWVPIGSKIIAEFVGAALTNKYKYIMLIDDDVHLPANLPIVTNRINVKTKCIGYTIKSTGANGAIGTVIQQCQDVEYKFSGLTRTFCGRYGSAIFPHGAIILWERVTLQNLFNVHPGYVISEDWFFGHAARSSGFRIEFCSQVFVETETPPNFIMNGKSDRGGFGEMTVYKQRFGRWNYFIAKRLWEDIIYILFSWRLGWREIVTKLFVMVEVHNSVMAFLRPFVTVITVIAAWRLLLILTAGTMGCYILIFCIFNAIHLRRKNEMVAWRILPVYLGMKVCLLWVNTLSVYHCVYDYARFFSKRHERVIENRQALEAVYNIRLGTRMTPLDTEIREAVLVDFVAI